MEVQAELPLEASSARKARVALEPFQGRMARDRFSELLLVATELVTNCVRHGGQEGMIAFAVLLADGVARLEVTCRRGETTPAIAPVAADVRLGLRIVDQLASHWGVHQQGRYTTVWVELPLA